jgi:hypothetical protein
VLTTVAIGANEIVTETVWSSMIAWPKEYPAVDGGNQILPRPCAGEPHLTLTQAKLITQDDFVAAKLHNGPVPVLTLNLMVLWR